MKKLLLGALLLSGALTTQAQTSMPNGDMENWVNYSAGIPLPTQLTRPNNWHSADSLLYTFNMLFLRGNAQKQLTQSSDAFAGTKAAMIKTKYQDTSIIPGILCNAKITIDLTSGGSDLLEMLGYDGGTPINTRVSSVSANVKHTATGGGEAMLNVAAVLSGAAADGGDSIVGTGMVSVTSQTAYTQINADIDYDDPNVVPNKLMVVFMTDFEDTTSTLLIDGVSYADPRLVGIKNIFGNGTSVEAFPNPANSVFTLQIADAQTYDLKIVDITGRQVYASELRGKKDVSVSNWTPGVYFYQITNRQNNAIYSNKFVVE